MMLVPHSYIGKQIGIFGQQGNLPSNSYTWAPGEVIGTYFTAQRNGLIFEQLCRVNSVNPGNRMKAAIFNLTGPDSANNGLISPDEVNFGTSDSILSFRQNKFIQGGQDYVLVFQAEDECNYWFDNALSNFYFNIGAYAFGSIPNSFTGVFTNLNICQYWAKYYF